MIKQAKTIALALSAAGVFAGAAHAEGFYAGIQQNLTGFTVEEEYGTATDNEFSGVANQTLFVGYDVSLGNLVRNLVVGGEFGLGLFNSSSAVGDTKVDTASARAGSQDGAEISRHISREFSLRGRVGYDLSEYLDGSLVYGSLGFHSLATSGIDGGRDFEFADAEDATVSGITYGIGAEIGVIGDLAARVEYTLGALNRLSLGVAYQF